jgi:hypothetical protein
MNRSQCTLLAIVAASLGLALFEYYKASILKRQLRSADATIVVLKASVTINSQKNRGGPTAERNDQSLYSNGRKVSTDTVVDHGNDSVTNAANNRFARRYGGFARQQGLSMSQTDQLFSLLQQRESMRLDLQAAVRDQGLTDQNAIAALRTNLSQPIQQDLRELLGDEGYSALNSYDNSTYYHDSYVTPLLGTFSAAGVPLTDAEQAELTSIVAANDHPIKLSGANVGNESQIDWPTVVSQTQGTLSPTQVNLLQIQGPLLNSAIPTPVPTPP